jgi:L-seryl-tRNA(Ser) seleniumtransferase
MVLDAMVEAGSDYVFIIELQAAAGRSIADRLDVEAEYISAGASAGMTLAAAVCMGGQDLKIRSQLPDTKSAKKEIIVFRGMRTKYDQAFRVAGAHLVEIERSNGWVLETAISEKTAVVAYILEHAHPGGIPLDRLVQIAHARDVPVIVDAAAELPPVENLWQLSQTGADLTVFGGREGHLWSATIGGDHRSKGSYPGLRISCLSKSCHRKGHEGWERRDHGLG